MSDSIDCDLLTGFLGSGKTTLLNAWLRSPAAKGTAVVVNEVGDIGIDQLVLAQVTDNVTLLESGCLCCTLSGSLRETLLDVVTTARTAGFALTRIVVETTGLAEPLPILHSLLGDKILTDTLRLNQVVVTVDGQQGLQQLSSQPESVRQLAAAECVVLTKCDQTTSYALQALRRAVHTINPLASIVESVDGSASTHVFTAKAGERQRHALQDAMGVIQAPHLTARPRSVHHSHDGPCSVEHACHEVDPASKKVFHSRVTTLGFYIDHRITWAGLAAWWHLVSSHYGDNLLRSKGLLHMTEGTRPWLFMQTVGKVFHSPQSLPAWPDSDLRSRLVCIGVSLDADWLERSLMALRIDEPGVMPSTLEELSFLIPYQSE